LFSRTRLSRRPLSACERPIGLEDGPLGNTVNLASRVQGATKYLQCRLLITGATWQSLDDRFATRRLCHVHGARGNFANALPELERQVCGRTDWAQEAE
jgi:hypothetical protein